MARTPSKKKPSRSIAGIRHSRQHVHVSESNVLLPNSKGYRHGSHGPPGSQRAPIPLVGDQNNERRHDPNIRHFCNAPPGGSTSASNAANSTTRKRDDDVIEIDSSPSTVADEGEHPLQQLVAYHGDEEPEDVQIKRALLKSRMAELLKRKSNSSVLGFSPDHYKSLIIGLMGPSPEFPCCDELIAMALQADPVG